MKDPVILWSSISLTLALIFAQAAIALIARKRPGKDVTELKLRTRTWWIILILIEGALYLGKPAMLFLMGSVSFFGLREYLTRVPTRTVDREVLFWVFLAIPLQFFLIYEEWVVAFLCFVPVYALSVIALRLLLVGQPKGFIMALATFQLGLVSTVYSIGHIAFLPLLRSSDYELAAGGVLFLIVITQLNDVFQFVSGKLFGRRKIMPLISPKKTWEGFVGGVVLTSILSASTAPFLTPLTRGQGLAVGACLAIFGFFGDVLMSAIKRDLGIKDFSQLLPGHGGVLDRIDSLVISAPLFFHLIRFFQGGAP